MKLLFWLVKNKINSKGEAPIYCRITINGKRAEINTEICAKECDFDNTRKKLKGNSELVKNKNRQLESINHKIHNLYFSESLKGNNNVTAIDLKERYTIKRTVINLIIELIREFSNECYKIYSNLTKFETQSRYINIIESALKELHKTTISISQCDNYFLDQLAHFLVKNKGYKVSYVKKVISFLKSALKYAFNRRYVDRIYSNEYKVPFTTKSEFIYLNEMEVNKIEKHIFDEHLQKCADAFLVQCYTGLAYVDLTRLHSGHLSQDSSGLVWIDITRQKVDTADCLIPVLPQVWRILKKYKFDIPLISIQKYNTALKKIAKEIGINKNVTSHVGRKTYGTLLLNKDVPIETVSSLLGHSNIRITQKHYAKVLHMKIAKDIRLVL